MNIFKYNSFYSSLIKSKKNQDIIDLIIRAKGFNNKSKSLTISHGVNSPKNVPQAFYDSFLEVGEKKFSGIYSFSNGSYLTTLDSNIDLEPVCIARKKFSKHDKERSKIIKKYFANFQKISGYFLISFQNKKEKFLCFLDIHQIYEHRSISFDPFFIKNFKFVKIIKTKLSYLELNKFYQYFDKEYYHEFIAIKDNDRRGSLGIMLKKKITEKFEKFNWKFDKTKSKIEKKYLINRSELDFFFKSPKSFSKNCI